LEVEVTIPLWVEKRAAAPMCNARMRDGSCTEMPLQLIVMQESKVSVRRGSGVGGI
jgi:hypothetical protein